MDTASRPRPTRGGSRLRIAPSPTGDPHVGTAYMALFNLAYARQQDGTFILRIEDTDQVRYQADSEQQILETLRWLGLTWDEGPDVGGLKGPYRQSERLATYRPYVDALLSSGHAYLCWCSPQRLAQLREEQAARKDPVGGYDRLCHGKTAEQRAELPGFSPTPVVRMLVPDDVELTFPDLIRGTVTAPHPDDQVILKADGFPTYHLAVVVDDHEMGITHVVRGEEWISSTPKHLLLYRWLGLEPPLYAHMPLLRNADRSKISKRKNPAARLMWFREQGYLPEALVNFLALLAYPPLLEPDGTEREVFTFEEFADRFDWAKVNPVGPIFDLKKLDWLSGVTIRHLSIEDLAARLLPVLVQAGVLPPNPSLGELGRLKEVTALIQPRLTRLTEAVDWVSPFYAADDDLPIDEDARAQLNAEAPTILQAAISALEALPTDEGDLLGAGRGWTAAAIEAALRAELVDHLQYKPRVAFGPIRTAIAGKRVSPPLFESMDILGRHSTLRRLANLRATLPDVP